MPGLTALAVKNAKPGRHVDGHGLCLVVKPTGGKSWVLRIQVAGRRRDIGLGSIAELTLAEAREKAAALRKAAKSGRDPVLERDGDKRLPPTFQNAAIACHTDLKGGWGAKAAAAFLSSLETHAYPKLGNIRVDLIEAWHVQDMLMPIWLDIPIMARKVRGRIATVLNYAKAKGWRTTEAPSRSIAVGLPKQAKSSNFAAMPYKDVPAFVAELRDQPETFGRLALLFTIFTAARGGEVRQMRWSHLDLEQRLWNRPAHLMKSKTAHAVTLNQSALSILEHAAVFKSAPDALVFMGKSNKTISDMTLTKVMRDAKLPFTVHGFRSSFRDWAAEMRPSVPDAAAEAALAHVVPDQVVRAYKRTPLIEIRRGLLEDWGNFIDGREGKLVRLSA